MLDHTNYIHFWKWWRPCPPLPAHLPRLLLAQRYHPRYVRRCQVTQEMCATLRLLDWEQLPHSLSLHRQGERSVPLAAYIGAYLVKIDQDIPTLGKLRTFLRFHPALLWALGFPLSNPNQPPSDQDIESCLPSQQHFSKKLARIPNEVLQTLLDSQVGWLSEKVGSAFAQVVSIDTKHIIAWVKENNEKAYVKNGRFDNSKQPAGDADCKLGCKRRRNQSTPQKEGKPASQRVDRGEYYWGYASGVVTTKVAGVGEFVLAELTQTFDHADVAYFLPLMAQVEQRLGFRPPFGTADAAFDAWYVHYYFYNPTHDGFAAVPLRNMKQGHRLFDEAGWPLCAANLSMPLKSTFTNRSSFVQHRRGRYVCPLLHPEPSATACPIQHEKWLDGGCKLVMPTAPGARLRYQLDREGDAYKMVYKQRTAVERIFSQAVALGIERPKLRNQSAIANQNTLIYLLINCRLMRRLWADDA